MSGTYMPRGVPSSLHPALNDMSAQTKYPSQPSWIAPPSYGHTRPGAMRVAKPKSANNSPRMTMDDKLMMIMTDPRLGHLRQEALDQAPQQARDFLSTYYTNSQEPVKRSRPVSWHSACHVPESQGMQIPMLPPNFSQFGTPLSSGYQPHQYLPPTPATYSGRTSPMAGYSPLTPLGAAVAQPASLTGYTASWMPTPQTTSSLSSLGCSPGTLENFQAHPDQVPFNWSPYAPQCCAAPPTPDECHIVEPQTVPLEESIPYEPLDKQAGEEEGEILVGLGLYDPPSKTDTDTSLDYYRTTTSRLLDTTYRNGKGWKLEEAWEPPSEDDEDSEGDADGEQQGEEDE